MSQRVSYWLIPAEPHKARFTEIVRELAVRFDAPVFDPHVTIYSGPLAPGDRPAEIIAGAGRDFAPMTLRVSGVSFSEEFTKTLFVEFEPSAALERLCETLKRQHREPADYDLKPHLSLLYAPLDRATKESLAHSLSFAGDVTFDAIQAVLTGAEIRCRADVERWRVVAAFPRLMIDD